MKEESVHQTIELIKKNWPEAWEKLVPEVILFFRIEEQLQKAIDVEVSRFDLVPGDFKVLFRLCVCGADTPQSPTSLYKNLGLTSGGLTKILHRLEAKGLITRVNNPDDRRSTLVQISSVGKQLTSDMFDGVIEQDKQYFSVLTREERKLLNVLFEKLLRLSSAI